MSETAWEEYERKKTLVDGAWADRVRQRATEVSHEQLATLVSDMAEELLAGWCNCDPYCCQYFLDGMKDVLDKLWETKP